MTQKEAFAKAGKICKALPGVTERISWGHPNWLVGGKMFAAVGPGHGGPHLVFKVADRSEVEGDARFVRVNDVGKWGGHEDWWFYFFDFAKEDDWDALKHLIEVSWELHFAALSKKKQDEIFPPKESAAPKAAVAKKTAKSAKAKRAKTSSRRSGR